MTSAPGLVHPTAPPLLDASHLLGELHRRTGQVVLLHTYSPVTAQRVCIAAAGTHNEQFLNALARTPTAIARLRQAPLDSDAPGLVILANLGPQTRGQREDLRQIRAARLAETPSPLPHWHLVAVSLRHALGTPLSPGAEPHVNAAVSILAPQWSAGAHVVAYGPLLQSTVRAISQTPLASHRPALPALRAS
jgi:hypothetical protein